MIDYAALTHDAWYVWEVKPIDDPAWKVPPLPVYFTDPTIKSLIMGTPMVAVYQGGGISWDVQLQSETNSSYTLPPGVLASATPLESVTFMTSFGQTFEIIAVTDGDGHRKVIRCQNNVIGSFSPEVAATVAAALTEGLPLAAEG